METVLEPLLTGLVSPTDAASLDDGHILVADQIGLVVVVTLHGGDLPRVALDLRDRLHPVDPNYDEGGLLAILPVGGKLFVFYTRRDGVDVVSTFDLRYGPPVAVDATSERIHLMVPLGPPSGPGKWVHHGGRLALGPGGAIYVAVGDGGPQKDEPGFTPRSQDPSDPRGKILQFADGRFTVYASGLRNPWGLTITPEGGFVADVGLKRRESIHLLRRGANYGWPAREGTLVDQQYDVQFPGPFDAPIVEYDHSQIQELERTHRGNEKKPPIAVIGGRSLGGKYIFGDLSGYVFVAQRNSPTRSKLLPPLLNAASSEWSVTRVIVLPPRTYLKSIAEHGGSLLLLTSSELGPRGTGGVVWRVAL